MLNHDCNIIAINNAINALLLSDKQRIFVAIDGMSASGKTSFANELSKQYDANIFHMDDFFLGQEMRTKERLAQVGGNVLYERFKAEVIVPLEKCVDFTYSIYDCKTGELRQSELVTPKKLNIIEGAYSMHPYFGTIYDLKILILIETDKQQKRILERNGEFMLARFTNEWIPMENKYIEKANLKNKADYVLSEKIDK